MDLIVGDDIAAKQTSSSGGCSSGTNMYLRRYTRYVPVCLPAFTPERCIREDEEGALRQGRLLVQPHARREAECGDAERQRIIRVVHGRVAVKDLAFELPFCDGLAVCGCGGRFGV